MPELSITDEQSRRLESVCADLEAAFVGPYGHVPPEDALEYLLDTYSPPGETAAVSAAGTDGADAEGGSKPIPEPEPDLEPEGRSVDDLTTIDGVGEVTAEALVEAGFDSRAAVAAADPAALTAVEGIGEKQAVDIVAAVTGTGGVDASDGISQADRVHEGEVDDDDDDAGSRDGGGEADGGEAGGGEAAANSPADALQQARDLLAAHDDRWRESSGDEPYEVDLPDGSTEGVRTKDDVKRLLFKHWR